MLDPREHFLRQVLVLISFDEAVHVHHLEVGHSELRMILIDVEPVHELLVPLLELSVLFPLLRQELLELPDLLAARFAAADLVHGISIFYLLRRNDGHGLAILAGCRCIFGGRLVVSCLFDKGLWSQC